MPPNRIFFTKGKSRIYEFQQFSGIRTGYFVICGLIYFIAYKVARKLYNFSERSWFGVFFYGSLGLMVFPRIPNLHRTFNKIVKHIDLKQDGKHVVIGRGFYFTYKEELVDIAQISKPIQPDEASQLQQFMSFAFPVVFNEQLFYLPREKQNILDHDLLPAVLNGKYIETSVFEDEIIVE